MGSFKCSLHIYAEEMGSGKLGAVGGVLTYVFAKLQIA